MIEQVQAWWQRLAGQTVPAIATNSSTNGSASQRAASLRDPSQTMTASGRLQRRSSLCPQCYSADAFEEYSAKEANYTLTCPDCGHFQRQEVLDAEDAAVAAKLVRR